MGLWRSWRVQVVRVGSHASSSLTLNTGLCPEPSAILHSTHTHMTGWPLSAPSLLTTRQWWAWSPTTIKRPTWRRLSWLAGVRTTSSSPWMSECHDAGADSLTLGDSRGTTPPSGLMGPLWRGWNYLGVHIKEDLTWTAAHGHTGEKGTAAPL